MSPAGRIADLVTRLALAGLAALVLLTALAVFGRPY